MRRTESSLRELFFTPTILRKIPRKSATDPINPPTRRQECFLIREGMLRRLFIFSRSYTTDGIHLNPQGHARIARRLRPILRDIYKIP